MLNNPHISKEVMRASRNAKIIRFGQIVDKEDPWKQITGKILLKRKVSIEDMAHSQS